MATKASEKKLLVEGIINLQVENKPTKHKKAFKKPISSDRCDVININGERCSNKKTKGDTCTTHSKHSSWY